MPPLRSGGRRGRLIVNVVPPFSVEVTSMVPLCAEKHASKCSTNVPKPGRELSARRAPHSQTLRKTGLVPPSANRCEPSTSPRNATPLKKPGTANVADSGQIGAEHQIRTGDLRLGNSEEGHP